jgi:hypothetical protein
MVFQVNVGGTEEDFHGCLQISEDIKTSNVFIVQQTINRPRICQTLLSIIALVRWNYKQPFS